MPVCAPIKRIKNFTRPQYFLGKKIQRADEDSMVVIPAPFGEGGEGLNHFVE